MTPNEEQNVKKEKTTSPDLELVSLMSKEISELRAINAQLEEEVTGLRGLDKVNEAIIARSEALNAQLLGALKVARKRGENWNPNDASTVLIDAAIDLAEKEWNSH